MPPSRLWSLSCTKCECPKPQKACEGWEEVFQSPQGTCGPPQPQTSMCFQGPVSQSSVSHKNVHLGIPASAGSPGMRLHHPPCKVPGPWHPNVPSLSPVPSSLQPTGKCLLYCNGVLEPLYLCPNGARCATWFQDPTRFTGTMVRSSCALNWVCRHSPGIQIAQAADSGKNR